MHTAAIRKLKLNADYQAMHVRPDALAEPVNLMRKGFLDGFNVTVPHKLAIIKYLDALTPAAKKIGAVNTVYRRGKKVIGDNTDGAGFLASLKHQAGFHPRGKNCVIIGAGGAALGIAHALAASKCKTLTVINRSAANADKICLSVKKAQKMTQVKSIEVRHKISATPAALEALLDTDLVINTTTLGMKGIKWPDLGWVKKLGKKTLIADIVYNPRKTPLLGAAKKQKLRTLEGYGMLLYQGALAFTLFTRRKAPVEVMERALLRSLA